MSEKATAAMIDPAALIDRLWSAGAGPDDRRALTAAVERLAGADGAAGALRDELAAFLALIELAAGAPIPAPRTPPPGSPARSVALAAAAALWSAAVAHDVARLDAAIAALGRAVAAVGDGDPALVAARGWADLALAGAALAAADRDAARRRLDAVARSGAPVPLRVTALLRLATLEPSRLRCREATALAGTEHPLLAQQARIAGALVDYLAGDRGAAERALLAEASHGELGLLPRILLASLADPERATALLAEGLADAAERRDAFAYTMCTLVGARRYAALGRDVDALLALTQVMLHLRPIAPAFADVLDDERGALRAAWGDERYAAAQAAALAVLGGG